MKIQFFLKKISYHLLKILKIKIVYIKSIQKGIGHHITEPLSIVKLKKLGLYNQKIILFFSLDLTYSLDKKPHFNESLISYLKPFLITIIYEYHEKRWERIKFKIFSYLLSENDSSEIFWKTKDKYKIRHHTLETAKIMSNLKDNAQMFLLEKLYSKPLLKIKRRDLFFGQKVFKSLGIPKDAWFITFHLRTQNYYQGINSEEEYSNRCARIDSYYLALKKIVDLGGYCFCIGANKNLFTPKIKSLGKQVVNFSEVNCNSDKISPFLLAQCKFFLGCNSGPALIPGNFGIPVVQVNTSPYWGIPLFKDDLYIFKKLWNIKEKRFLTFKEMHQKPLSYTNLDSQFKKLGIKPIDNTPEEILDVVSEMLDRLKDQHEYPQDVLALQKKYAESFLEDNYAYYHQAKVGARFLKSFMKAENESFSNLLEKKSKIPLHTKVGGE